VTYDEQLADRLRAALDTEAEVTERAMFGGLAFLVRGSMAVGVGADGGLLVRCDPADTAALLGQPGVGPFESRGREMDGWLHVDADAVGAEGALERWTALGVAYVRSLPHRR
jgi:TfoX/Sxy family transcriptional regulator of competence genes